MVACLHPSAAYRSQGVAYPCRGLARCHPEGDWQEAAEASRRPAARRMIQSRLRPPMSAAPGELNEKDPACWELVHRGGSSKEPQSDAAVRVASVRELPWLMPPVCKESLANLPSWGDPGSASPTSRIIYVHPFASRRRPPS